MYNYVAVPLQCENLKKQIRYKPNNKKNYGN